MNNFWPTFADVVNTGVNRALRNLGKCCPGNVVSYDSATETATIRLGVHRLVPSWGNEEVDEVEELPALVSVPVAWYRARGVSIVGDLGPGDPILVVCCDRDISAWRRSGAPAEPDDSRVHSWSSAVALPGVQADVEGFEAPGDAAALASAVFAELDALRTKVHQLATAMNTHVHPDPASGNTGTSSITVTAPAAIGDVASTILLVDE
jgi:hypothetical protein